MTNLLLLVNYSSIDIKTCSLDPMVFLVINFQFPFTSSICTISPFIGVSGPEVSRMFEHIPAFREQGVCATATLAYNQTNWRRLRWSSCKTQVWRGFMPHQNKRMAENVMCYLWVAGRLFDVMARRPTRREVVGLVPSRHCSTCSALPALYICVQYTNEKN